MGQFFLCLVKHIHKYLAEVRGLGAVSREKGVWWELRGVEEFSPSLPFHTPLGRARECI
jgi:hypothetical protein